jgi:hypothetical protein
MNEKIQKFVDSIMDELSENPEWIEIRKLTLYDSICYGKITKYTMRLADEFINSYKPKEF